MEAEGERDKQIGLEAHCFPAFTDPEEMSASSVEDGEELDRSAQLIRKYSELETAPLDEEDDSIEAKSEPSNENPSQAEKETGPEKCPNQEKGCKWNGKPEDLEDHLNKFPGSEIPGEVEGCGFQTVECECKEKVVYNYKSAHKREHQNHQEVACEFEYAGCEFRCPQYLMKMHLEADMLQHVTLLSVFTKRGRSQSGHLEANHVGLHAYCWVLSFVVILLVVALVEDKIKLQNFHQDWEREEFYLSMSLISHSNLIHSLQAQQKDHSDLIHEQGKELRCAQSELEARQKQLENNLNTRVDSLQYDVQRDLTKEMLKVVNKKSGKLERRLAYHMNDTRERMLKFKKKYDRKYEQIKRNVITLQKDIRENVTKRQLQIKKKLKDVDTEFNSQVRDFDRQILKLQEFQFQVEKTVHTLVLDVANLKSGFSKKYIDDTIRKIQSMMCTWLPRAISGC